MAGRPFTGVFWGLEAVHSGLVALICLVIFLKTREMERLSSHKGVRYFRLTFLFFGIASLLKLLTRHLALSFFFYPGILEVADWVIGLGVFGIIYTYTIAAFYLLYSISWKDLKQGLMSRPANLHLMAAVVALLVLVTNASALYILFQVFVIAYSIGIIHTKSRAGTKTPMLVIYELLLVFWMLNLLDTTLAIGGLLQAGIYTVSSVIFLVILYKVWNKLKVVAQ